ncbi:hypothetical protein BCR42DRAFT_417001 [Absidia repens]|uniref:Uncharacterized protein n=1 Tax=Absidia repens TaxID=90262 RepID=A0A1X2IDB6_9FUNG|nr:hypothetical protein BCR42DRAFT_417001 [Absidia repens]
MADVNLHALGEEFQQLRQKSGKDLSEQDQERKQQVMNSIVEQLGLPGTPAADLLSTLGKPDEMVPLLQYDNDQQVSAQVMPGPVLDGQQAASTVRPPYYFVYYCRGKHDHYYFKIDSVKETVITSDWRH